MGAAGETPMMGVAVESRTDTRSTSRLALWFSVERLLTCSPRGVMRPRRAVRFARWIDRLIGVCAFGRALRRPRRPAQPSVMEPAGDGSIYATSTKGAPGPAPALAACPSATQGAFRQRHHHHPRRLSAVQGCVGWDATRMQHRRLRFWLCWPGAFGTFERHFGGVKVVGPGSASEDGGPSLAAEVTASRGV